MIRLTRSSRPVSASPSATGMATARIRQAHPSTFWHDSSSGLHSDGARFDSSACTASVHAAAVVQAAVHASLLLFRLQHTRLVTPLLDSPRATLLASIRELLARGSFAKLVMLAHLSFQARLPRPLPSAQVLRNEVLIATRFSLPLSFSLQLRVAHTSNSKL